MASDAKDYGLVEGVVGNEGETIGNLAVVALLSPSPNMPNCCRIIVGSTKGSDVDCGQFALSVTKARELIAKLEAACADVVAACPSAATEVE